MYLILFRGESSFPLFVITFRTQWGFHGAEPNECHGRRASGQYSQHFCSHARLCTVLSREGGLHRQQHPPSGAWHPNRWPRPRLHACRLHLPQHHGIGLDRWSCTRTLPADEGRSRVCPSLREDAADSCHLSKVVTAERRACTDLSEGGTACFTVTRGCPLSKNCAVELLSAVFFFFLRQWVEQRELFLYREEKHYQGWGGCSFT